MSEEREQKFHTDLMWLPSYPDLPVDREPLVFLSEIAPCVVICNLAGWDNNWTGFKRRFFVI